MSGAGDRLLSFEIHDALFALPIAGVLEVADTGSRSCVPTLPPDLAWVCNYRGEALPVLSRERLLDLREATTHGAPRRPKRPRTVRRDDRNGFGPKSTILAVKTSKRKRKKRKKKKEAGKYRWGP